MAAIRSIVGFSGNLQTRKLSAKRAPLAWKVQNWASMSKLRALAGTKLAKPFGKLFGVGTFTAKLYAKHWDSQLGRWVDYGLLDTRVVTTAFVNFMVDNMQVETTAWGDFKYHDSGVGVTAPAITDTDIETTDGEARVAGTQVDGASANIYKSVGTITYTTSKAITEHGLFSALTGTTLLDRSTFTAINVVSTDQIEFTYELTCTAGG